MATIPGLSNLAAPASGALMWITDTSATPQDRNHSISQLAKNIKKLNQEFVIDTSGGAISLTAWQTENLILTYAGASTVTLPEASTCIGYRVRIMAAYAGAALVTITPHTDDHIDLLAANVSIFLNNSDGGANVQKFRYVDLVAIASGYWAVIGGDYCPSHDTDTSGSHLVLGRLHHLPITTATSRQLVAEPPPAVGSFSVAKQVTGSLGIPGGAKAIRARIKLSGYSTAAGLATLMVALSSNNDGGNAPTETTPHPIISIASYCSASGQAPMYTGEVDIPLKSDGTLYIYSLLGSNVTIASCNITISIVGYYMGD